MRAPRTAALLPAFLAACASARAAVPPRADFYVAPNGSDTADGTSRRPFATPARAVRAVRELVARGLRKDVLVLLRGGTYHLDSPLEFGPADSGTERFSVTYAAYPGEKAVLSGGRRITGWKKGPGDVLTADVPEVRAGKWFFRQLFVNDERAVRARWPEEDGVVRIASVADGVKTFTFNTPLPTEDLAGQDAEIVVYENWSISRALVTSCAGGRLSVATPVGWIGHGDYTTASPGKPVYIEHARAFLDRPGEWHLDRARGVLSRVPGEGEDAGASVVVAPALEQVVRIAGGKDAPVRNLVFRGLSFEHVEFPLPEFGYSEIQAGHFGTSTREPTHVQPVAIECVYAEGCRFDGCRVAHTGASGIGFGPGCRRNVVSGCVIEDIGGSGVMIGWRGKGELESRSLDADWADPADAPAGNEVSNCLVQRCGATSLGCVGIYAAFSADTRIARNLVRTMPYTGVSIGYRWNTTSTSQARCIVEYNHIHDVMRKLADGGGIYTLGFQPGTVLRGNHIHDVHRSAFAHGGAPNNGFFVDEGSKGFLFEGNLVYSTSGTAVRFNQNRSEWHTWKDNLFDAAVPKRAKGRVGCAMVCAGGGDFLEVPHAAALEPERLTIEASIRLEEFPSGNDPRRWLVNKNGNEWVQGHYALVIMGKEAGAMLNVGGGRENSFDAWSDSGPLALGKWQHLAMTYDGATLAVYCDGKPVASKAVGRRRVGGGSPLVIGRRQDGFGISQFKGLIDEVRVYGRSLAPAEIAARARSAGKAAPGAVGEWGFDEDERALPDIERVKAKAGPEPEFRKALLGE